MDTLQILPKEHHELIEKRTEKMNISFIGIPLSAGDHTIEFIYEKPFLTIGLFLTIAGLIGLLILIRQSSKKDN